MNREHLQEALDALDFKATKFRNMLAMRRMNKVDKAALAADIARIEAANEAIASVLGVPANARERWQQE